MRRYDSRSYKQKCDALAIHHMMSYQYEYSLDDCDVSDKNSLRRFREKRVQWLEWLRHDEYHAISLSVSNLVWNDTAFRLIVDVARNNDGGALGNSLVLESLINGYFAQQTLAIRRLMDTRNDVISLRRLLRDIKQNICLLTRENIIAFDGLPYDYETIKSRIAQRIATVTGGLFVSSKGPEAYWVAERIHAQFDSVCGIGASNRQRGDCIPIGHIRTLERWLDESDSRKIVEWTHKFLAHAADRGSRDGKPDIAAHLPELQNITDAIRTLVRVSHALWAYVLFDGGHSNVVPIPQFDQFHGLCGPNTPGAAIPDLRSHWDELIRERNAYLDGVLEGMLNG